MRNIKARIRRLPTARGPRWHYAVRSHRGTTVVGYAGSWHEAMNIVRQELRGAR